MNNTATKQNSTNPQSLLPKGYYYKEFFGTEDKTLLHLICKLRYKIWEQEGTPLEELQTFAPHNSWFDNYEAKSYHWAVFDSSNQLVASARLLPCKDISNLPYENWYTNLKYSPKGSIGHLGRDIVISACRKQGIGQFLNIIREEKARQLKLNYLIADIPSYRSSSFAQLGYEEIQGSKPGTLLVFVEWSVVIKNLHLHS